MAPDHIIRLARTPTLAELFRQRVARSGDQTAYLQPEPGTDRWVAHSWNDTAREVARWQQALLAEGLEPGDRVMIMARNGWPWVIFDQAALGLGLVPVPVFMNDRAENIAWIAEDCGARFLLIQGPDQWQALEPVLDRLLASIQRIVCLDPCPADHPALVERDRWLPESGELITREADRNSLATIIYTSGTTGRPKGVMLSHYNILWDLHAALEVYPIEPDNLFLSFLPLSHALERTAGYYLPMACGATVAYNRAIPLLAEDLALVRPTIMISVPRIFERIYGRITEKLAGESEVRRWLFRKAVDLGWRRFEHQQGRAGWSPGLLVQPLFDRLVGRKVRARLGGRLRFTVCGGAALSPEVARLFIGLGIPIQQGYGLTETSPVISVNPLDDNRPETVGPPLPGVEVRLGDGDELLTRSPAVMLGYWNRPDATAEMIDAGGWLHTGDRAAIEPSGHIRITGRLKEIIVLSTGEKVPPADMENAITLDPYIDQAMVVGEGRPYLAALVVLAPGARARLESELGGDPQRIEAEVLARVQAATAAFPGYAKIHRVAILDEPLTPENGLLTPTLKLRRNRILEAFSDEMQKLYAGH